MSPARNYRYYDLVMAAFVTVLICSNLIGPAKIAQVDFPLVGALTFGAGVLFFPISYVFGDILTEVYGYSRARKVIWAGFAGLAFAWCLVFWWWFRNHPEEHRAVNESERDIINADRVPHRTGPTHDT